MWLYKIVMLNWNQESRNNFNFHKQTGFWHGPGNFDQKFWTKIIFILLFDFHLSVAGAWRPESKKQIKEMKVPAPDTTTNETDFAGKSFERRNRYRPKNW